MNGPFFVTHEIEWKIPEKQRRLRKLKNERTNMKENMVREYKNARVRERCESMCEREDKKRERERNLINKMRENATAEQLRG